MPQERESQMLSLSTISNVQDLGMRSALLQRMAVELMIEILFELRSARVRSMMVPQAPAVQTEDNKKGAADNQGNPENQTTPKRKRPPRKR
jgi:hypothetical protein